MPGDDNTESLNDEWDKDDITVDGTDIRVYVSGDMSYPSVTTITDSRPTPAKDKSIQGWRNWLKGQPDRPDPGDVLRFKGARGTLAHYAALDPLTGRDLAGEEEYDAYQKLDGWEHRHDDAMQLATDDIAWFVEQFQATCEAHNIAEFDGRGKGVDATTSRVRNVEQYVVDHDVKYAGQYDLCYETTDGDTVIADLKTSKADSVSDLLDKKWPDYGMQLAAYARAADFPVDGIEVLWFAPDTRESAVITADDMPKSRAEYEQQFVGHAEAFHDQTLDDYFD